MRLRLNSGSRLGSKSKSMGGSGQQGRPAHRAVRETLSGSDISTQARVQSTAWCTRFTLHGMGSA
eukprot:8828700-Alexandrium_andersonii.AAC.1